MRGILVVVFLLFSSHAFSQLETDSLEYTGIINAEYPGGEESLYQFVQEEQDNSTLECLGTVYVRFIIDTLGNVSNSQIVQGLGNDCDEEVLRIINDMPKWVPGTHKGKKVPVAYILPVKFE